MAAPGEASVVRRQDERYEDGEGSEGAAVVVLQVGGSCGRWFEDEGLIDEAVDELLLDAGEPFCSLTLEGSAGCV